MIAANGRRVKQSGLGGGRCHKRRRLGGPMIAYMAHPVITRSHETLCDRDLAG
jgi:hypothetical protein